MKQSVSGIPQPKVVQLVYSLVVIWNLFTHRMNLIIALQVNSLEQLKILNPNSKPVAGNG
jgi:hypothetical protein